MIYNGNKECIKHYISQVLKHHLTICQHKRVVIRTRFVRNCLQTHPAHLTTIHYLQLIQLSAERNHWPSTRRRLPGGGVARRRGTSRRKRPVPAPPWAVPCARTPAGVRPSRTSSWCPGSGRCTPARSVPSCSPRGRWRPVGRTPPSHPHCAGEVAG